MSAILAAVKPTRRERKLAARTAHANTPTWHAHTDSDLSVIRMVAKVARQRSLDARHIVVHEDTRYPVKDRQHRVTLYCSPNVYAEILGEAGRQWALRHDKAALAYEDQRLRRINAADHYNGAVHVTAIDRKDIVSAVMVDTRPVIGRARVILAEAGITGTISECPAYGPRMWSLTVPSNREGLAKAAMDAARLWVEERSNTLQAAAGSKYDPNDANVRARLLPPEVTVYG